MIASLPELFDAYLRDKRASCRGFLLSGFPVLLQLAVLFHELCRCLHSIFQEIVVPVLHEDTPEDIGLPAMIWLNSALCPLVLKPCLFVPQVGTNLGALFDPNFVSTEMTRMLVILLCPPSKI